MKIVKSICYVIVTLAVLAVAVLFITDRVQSKRKVEESSNKVEQLLGIEEKVTISGEIIKESLNDIGELATQEYSFTEVETYSDQKQLKNFKVPFTKSSFVYSYDGMIKAGIDFADIEVEKDDLKKLIVVTIPESRILSKEIDLDSFQIYDEKLSVFNKLSITDFNDANQELLNKAVDKALTKGLLKKADDNAKKIIKNFIESTYGLSDYSVKVNIQE